MDNIEKVYNNIDNNEFNYIRNTVIETSLQVRMDNTIDKAYSQYHNMKKDIKERQKEKIWNFIYGDIVTELRDIEKEIITSSDFVKKFDILNKLSKLMNTLRNQKIIEGGK